MEKNLQRQILAKDWVNNNQVLLRRYKGEWLAYNGTKGIIAHDKEASNVLNEANKSGEWFVLKYVNPYTYGGLRRLVPIHFRPLHVEVWEPNAIVTIKVKEHEIELEMLVDSGADISTLTYQAGVNVGLERYENEVVDLAAGVNGTVEYVLRKVEMTIEGFSFNAPIGWLLNPNCDDLLLGRGREVVFDQFDIEFKQMDKQIVFKRRNENT